MSAATAPVTPVLSGALVMLRAGYCVQPCRLQMDTTTGKKDVTGLPNGWDTFGQDEPSVLRKFAAGANAYLVATGPSNVVVVDVDVKMGARGLASWASKLPGGFVVTTPTGGQHHYYRNDVGQVGCRAAILPGVDIRAHGGGVFGPGSLDGAYSVAYSAAEMPLWSAVGIDAGWHAAKSTAPRDEALAPAVTPARAQQIIAEQVAAVGAHAGRWAGDGFRMALMKAAYVIGGYVGAEQLTHEQAEAALVGAIKAAGYAPDADDEKWIEQGLTDGSARPLVVRAPFIRPSQGKPHGGINLPGEWWVARPTLSHARTCAHSRGRSADAVMGALLARVSSLVPGHLRVDTGIAAPASLNFYAILLGSSAAGKSTSAAVAESMLPIGVELDSPIEDIGSGPGVAAAFGLVNGDGVFEQTQHRVMFKCDEGELLLATSRNKESTTLATLRTAWTGQAFGQRNATQALNRRVTDYSLGLWVGLQPIHAAELFSARAVGDGTLQRFLWFSAADPSITAEQPHNPGRLPWDHSVLRLTDSTPLTLPTDIRRELFLRNVAVQRGELVPEPGQEHAALQQIKVSGLLAMLDGRRDIDHEDWQLAAVVLETSNAVAQSVREDIRARAADREAQRDAAAERRAKNAAKTAAEIEDTRLTARKAQILQRVTDKPGQQHSAVARNYTNRELTATALAQLEADGKIEVKTDARQHYKLIYAT
ncbi:MAG: bifunctional DNA primase/polymerase [Pseudonocardiaceae bacterium]